MGHKPERQGQCLVCSGSPVHSAQGLAPKRHSAKPIKEEKGSSLLSLRPSYSSLVRGVFVGTGGQFLLNLPLLTEGDSMAPGSPAPLTPPAASFHLLPVTVTRGLERNGDSAQFITTVEKPSHLSSWQRDRSCLCIWKGSKPYFSQGPFVFHLLKNQRVKDVGILSLDTVDLQCDMTLSDPGWCVSSMPGSELSAHVCHLTAVSQQVHYYLKWALATLLAISI